MKNAQTQLQALFGDKTRIKIELDDGDLVIEGYTELTEINLTAHSLDSLIVRNCPKLKLFNINNNEAKKVDLSQLTLDAAGKPVANKTLEMFYGNYNPVLDELNLKNCKGLKELEVNHCGTVTKMEGGEDIDESLNSIGFEDTKGLSFTGTDNLKELKGAKEAVDVILGAAGKLPMIGDPSDPTGQKEIVDVSALENNLIIKGSEKPNSPAKNDLDAIKSELGLGTSATQSQIIAKIRELVGPGYISKVSLVSDAEDSLKGLGVAEGEISKLGAAASARDVELSRNKLVNDKFNELQTKLNHAHYINIGLGTLSVGVLLILT
ncbi:1728_t:CDS:2 [Funneliformis geosporum]|uniref:1728_t:CDS:1 n=1 Tax=Funneliformis geosporum TaxID=1117311 RepID=A0A9W4SNF0_9GLOM|nr:1728_t:CDS:2 [Funneliformis geosporum]